MGANCGRERCYCCGNGHYCEPDRYPAALGETWTCPECGAEHEAFDPHTDPSTPLMARLHIPDGAIGWRTTGRP